MPFLFALTLFASAALLCAVQPMIGKMVLPLLGGSPAVWSTCLVFFQGALLGGYAYAHALAGWLGPRRQAALHVALLVLTGFAVPFAVAVRAGEPSEAHPAAWLLGLLLRTAALPFFTVAATAPLLQRWFAETGHRDARDPYFLYGASNLGSLLALLGYPLLVEPYLPLDRQARLWAWGFGGLALLVVACAAVVERSRWVSKSDLLPISGDSDGGVGLTPSPLVGEGRGGGFAGPSAGAEVRRGGLPHPTPHPDPPPQGRRESERKDPELGPWLGWVALAFVPSSGMLGVTAYLSSDIAPVPLLWVVPLALYLWSFAIVFARRPIVPRAWAEWALPIVVMPLTLVLGVGLVQPFWVPLHLLAFFLSALVCHGALARRRPEARHLTAFYLALSVGGALGGLFNAFLAPALFDRLAEYPLAVVLGCLALAWTRTTKEEGATIDPLPRERVKKPDHTVGLGREVAPPLLVFALAALLVRNVGHVNETIAGGFATVLASGLTVYAFYTFRSRPLRFSLMVGAVLLATGLAEGVEGRVLGRERNFFGVARVTEVVTATARFHRFFHGNTLHGQQDLDPVRRREPVAYFDRSGPVGQVFEAYNARPRAPGVAITGLGAGSLACYAEPGQDWTFYELDPAVARIARDPRYFTFLSDSRAGSLAVVLGDARLRLRAAPDLGYGLIVFDAFSSDAVPVHLLTREALRLYRAKLSPGGLLAFNATNRYIDFEPVLGTLARDAGLVCRVRYDVALDDEEKRRGKQPSIWAVMAGAEADLGPIASDPRWRPARTGPPGRVWRDDYSDVAGHLVLRRRFPKALAGVPGGLPTRVPKPR